MLIAKYTANVSGVVPAFNGGYVYEVTETENGGIYTVEINSDNDFTHCSFAEKSNLLTVEYLKITSNVTSMNSMFRNCNALTSLDVSNWDTSNVANMGDMFNNCHALTSLDVSNFDTSKVTSMAYMFYNCNALTSLDVSNFDTKNVASMFGMFQNCYSLTSLDVSNFDTSNVTNMSYIIFGCTALTSLDVSNFDTSNVTGMYAMFYNCNALTSLDVSNWDTSNVANMGDMFAGCNALTSLDLSNFNTSNVTDMSYMFSRCNALTSLDVRGFDTSNVTSMASMFYGCNALTSLDLSEFDTSKVTTTFDMFSGCTKLDNIGLIYSDINTINKLPTPTKATLYIDENLDQSLYTGSSILKIYETRSITINLPTALRSNGTIADRLYWDETDKHYYIEQWIDPNTEEILEEPNIIASGIVMPIEIQQYEKKFSIDLQNISPSHMSITVPYFDIPDDYEYNEADEVEYFKQSFELRYPDEDDVGSDFGFAHVNGDYNMGLKRLIDWVDFSTDEEFVRDFEQYFHKQYTFRYYLLVIVLGMVDNLGKNMMLDTFDHKIWMPRFYDMDTICSYDNTGQIKFDVDIEMEQGYWNTSASRLWTRIRDLFHDELVEVYKDMRANGMSYESFMRYFYDQQIAQIPQKYYNMDADVKYLPFADAYIGKAHGDGYEHLKRWLKKRLIFTDTLYDYQPSYINDVLTIRANTTEEMTIEIETYTPLYQHLSWYNGQMDKKKIDGKISVTFNGHAQAATDQEVLIYGGSNIKSIKGISTCNPSQLLIGAATKLIELDAKNCTLLSDINSNGANLLPHTYLTKLDLSGCTALPGTLNILNSPLLRHIDISGSSISAINKPSTLKNIEYMNFRDCKNFTTIDLSNLYMPRLKSCEDMFNGCSNMTGMNLSNWDIPNVTNMNSMFYGCTGLTSLDLSNFDTSNVTSMYAMFAGCSALTSLDVSNFDTKDVIDMRYMFTGCNSLKTLTANNMTHTNPKLFTDAINNGIITELIAKNWKFNGENVSLYELFRDNATIQKLDLSDWSNENVTNMGNMFRNCNTLTSLDVSGFDTSSVTDMSYMFYSCNALTSLDVSGFDTNKVTDMQYMFQSCYVLTSLDVSGWDTKNVTNMNAMFAYCRALTSLDVSNFDTTNVTSMYYMFSGCNALTSLDLSNFDTANVTDMKYMFYGCNALTSLDVSTWDTSKVTDMRFMFRECIALTSLDVNNFDTANVTNMSDMFRSCNTLTSLDLSNFDTTNVTDMKGMFYGCRKLTSLDVSNWVLNDITQTAISSLPIGDDKNEIYATVIFTIPSGWTLINPLTKTMFIDPTDLINLTDEEILTLTNEGWTII